MSSVVYLSQMLNLNIAQTASCVQAALCCTALSLGIAANFPVREDRGKKDFSSPCLFYFCNIISLRRYVPFLFKKGKRAKSKS